MDINSIIMARYYLIGGHDFDLKDNYIASKLIELSGTKKPNILLFPTATKDSLKAINNFKKEFEGLDYSLKIEKLYDNINLKDLYTDIEKCDIIYFTGGNTFELVDFIKNSIYLEAIMYATKRDIIIAGVSAGAMLFSKFGLGDIYSYSDNFNYYNYKKVNGLGILDIGFCPHYNLGDRLLFYKDMISDVNVAFACDEDAALYINGENVEIFKAKKKFNVYAFYKDRGFMMEKMELNKIVTLGPKGTFSELACKLYESRCKTQNEIEFYPTIYKTAQNIAKEGFGILPFENTLDGYVTETMDMLYKYNFNIVNDINVPVHFAFISKAESIKNVKKIYCQFKAKGQCIDFINKYGFEVIETESNVSSFELFNNSGNTYGAIVPIHIIKKDFPTVLLNVEDKENNTTRFLVVSTNETKHKIEKDMKASLILESKEDKPGVLMDALLAFKETKLNLTAIMSRPTKEGLGKYYFYIEFKVLTDSFDIDNLISMLEKQKDFKVKNLGFYKSL